jgi:hypothetical protein
MQRSVAIGCNMWRNGCDAQRIPGCNDCWTWSTLSRAARSMFAHGLPHAIDKGLNLYQFLRYYNQRRTSTPPPATLNRGLSHGNVTTCDILSEHSSLQCPSFMAVLRSKLMPAKHVTWVHPSKNYRNALLVKEGVAVVS